MDYYSFSEACSQGNHFLKFSMFLFVLKKDLFVWMLKGNINSQDISAGIKIISKWFFWQSISFELLRNSSLAGPISL